MSGSMIVMEAWTAMLRVKGYRVGEDICMGIHVLSREQ